MKRRAAGLTLVELLIALALGALLLLGIVQLVTVAGATTRLQDSQALVQDHARYATRLLTRSIAGAGFRPEPWDASHDIEAIAKRTADGVSSSGDRLVLRTWSDRNCFDNLNPATDAAGNPRFYLRESAFDVNGTGYLARSCRYGPSADALVSQVRRQGLLGGVETFQLLFGEDRDADGNVDRWVRAGHWSDEAGVLGVRYGLLLAGSEPVTGPVGASFRVLDTHRVTRPDGRLRKVVVMTTAIRSRGG